MQIFFFFFFNAAFHHFLTFDALIREELGTTYPSYTNGEKERLVCRPSRVDGVHDGFDPKIQFVKTADVWGVEKKWAGLYQSCAAHEDFKTRRSNV